MRQAMFSEDVAAQDGLLQRLDPRVKLVTLLGLLVVAAFLRTHPAAARPCTPGRSCSRRRRGSRSWFFVKRVWLFVPIFTGIVVLPATLSFITPGDDRRAALVLARAARSGSPRRVSRRPA